MEEKFSYLWGVFMWLHVNFSIIIHTVSIWLTLSLAIWRNCFKLFTAELTCHDRAN
jgi:hypothetical protein